MRVLGRVGVEIVNDSEVSSESDIFSSQYDKKASPLAKSPYSNSSGSQGGDIRMQKMEPNKQQRKVIKVP